MPRIAIELPNSYPFETILEIRVTDLNYGNHLGNDRVLGLVHEARLRYLAFLGEAEYSAGGIGLIQADAAINYKGRGVWGQKLKAQVSSAFEGNTWYFTFLLTDLHSGKEIARAKTGMVFFDYGREKIVRPPPRLLHT